ncbi:MAG: hypothetical protein HY823_15575 [Acidobacteria bacterium]|nr:hypothetical protein [Acidobacteriota bacterium]
METTSEVPDELPERPEGIGGDDPLAPRSPWSFVRDALPSGFGPWGLHLMGAWVLFTGLGATAWAYHLRGLAQFGKLPGGGSGLPDHWGELLTARDLWELVENGGWKHAPLGPAAPILAGTALIWALWAGWRMQAQSAGVPGRLGPWLLGLLDALLIGVLPLGALGGILLWLLAKAGASGFSLLGWLNLVGGGALRLALPSLFMLQWWFCRLGRAAGPGGLVMGSWKAMGAHLGHSFLRLWSHPIHWGSLALAGSILRAGLSFLALLAGWRLGGVGGGRVAWMMFLLLLASAGGAWLLGWFLRLAALFWAQDRRVRAAREALRLDIVSREHATAEP